MEILKLSLFNVWIKRKSYVKVLINFILVFVILCVTVIYSVIISELHKKVIDNNSSLNRLYINENMDKETLREIQSYDNVRNIILMTKFIPNNISKYFLIINDKKIELNNPVYSSIDIIDINSKTLSENYSIEFENKFKQSVFKYGKDIENVDEMIVCESFFDYIGMQYDENIINSNVQLLCDDTIVYSKKIIGILDSRVQDLSMYNNSLLCIKDDLSDCSEVVIEISLKDFSKSNSTLAILKNKYNCDYLFLGNGILESITMIINQKNFIGRFLSLVCFVIVLVFLLNIIQNQILLFSKNTGFYGVLKAQGASKRKIFWLIFAELFMICLIAMIISFLLSIFIIELLKSTLVLIIGLEIVLPSILTLFFILMLFVLLTLLFTLSITIIIYMFCIKKPSIELLKIGDQN